MTAEGVRPKDVEDPRWLLVERILATPDFQRSARLSEFLRHICYLTLEGREGTISEQYLGQALFGRPPDYDSSADTIVRSHALRLRRRLDQYFSKAGPSERMRLLIPLGGYTPTFVSTELPSEEIFSSSTSDPDEPVPSLELPYEAPGARRVSGEIGPSVRPYKLGLIVSLCFSFGLLVTVLLLWRVQHRLMFHEHPDRNHPLWSRLFNENEPTQIIMGDSGLVLFHAAARRYVSLQDYVNNDLSKQLPYVQHVDPEFARLLAGRRYTSIVDATTAVRLFRLPEARPDRTTVSFSRDMHLDDFKNGNIIMIGAQEADPWVELFEPQMDFIFSIDTPDRHTVYLNRHPLQGEPSVFNPEPGGPQQVYGVIAFLPNLAESGNVLLLEGINMAGTESAVDLLLDDQRLMPILEKIRRPDGTLPHFEMMIATSVVKDSPAPAHVVSIHVHR